MITKSISCDTYHKFNETSGGEAPHASNPSLGRRATVHSHQIEHPPTPLKNTYRAEPPSRSHAGESSVMIEDEFLKHALATCELESADISMSISGLQQEQQQQAGHGLGLFGLMQTGGRQFTGLGVLSSSSSICESPSRLVPGLLIDSCSPDSSFSSDVDYYDEHAPQNLSLTMLSETLMTFEHKKDGDGKNDGLVLGCEKRCSRSFLDCSVSNIGGFDGLGIPFGGLKESQTLKACAFSTCGLDGLEDKAETVRP